MRSCVILLFESEMSGAVLESRLNAIPGWSTIRPLRSRTRKQSGRDPKTGASQDHVWTMEELSGKYEEMDLEISTEEVNMIHPNRIIYRITAALSKEVTPDERRVESCRQRLGALVELLGGHIRDDD